MCICPWDISTLHTLRSKIHNAPYNPRFITDEAKRKLKGSIKRNGLLAPPTWNIRTGNIVGGHQRKVQEVEPLAL
jgi:ParB-like chromosome segregation protein Spo0J